MAKRDVVQYYLEQQSLYFELINNVKDLDDAFKAGIIDESQLKQAQQEIDVVKNNYERLSYIMFLLNKPNRKSNKNKEENINKEWYTYLKGSSKEAIYDESRDALADFKKLVKETKQTEGEKWCQNKNLLQN